MLTFNYLYTSVIDFVKKYIVPIFTDDFTDSIKLIQSNPDISFGQKPIHSTRLNTSPNLNINKSSTHRNYKSEMSLETHMKEMKLEWYCKNCMKKLPNTGNIYCCHDFIFCTPNCRDRFISVFRINNNI